MTSEKLFHELLGLGLNWKVTDSRFDRETGLVLLEICETDQLWETARCPKDGGYVFCYDHTEELTWRHLNVFEHRCEIRCKLPRGKCRQCGHLHRVRPPWEGLSMHFTKEFEAFALLLIREMPMRRVGELLKETDTRLWRMLFAHVAAAYQEADFSNVTCVGVDEMSIGKRHHYLSVFADLIERRVLFATEGKDQHTWAAFVKEFGEHNGHQHTLTQVSMDMSPAYTAGVHEWCRNAQIVYDKFHVIKQINTAVDKVRSAELRTAAAGVWQALHGTQWLWRKNPENLTEPERDRLTKIQDKNLWTAKAYQMRLVLQDIYGSAEASTARTRLRVWCRWVRWVARLAPKNLLQSMVKAAGMIQRHLTGILAHWKSGITNAFMEGLNSVFSAVKRKARGFRSSHYLITVLYLVAGKLRIPQM